MCDAVSALDGATYEGYCTVSEVGLTGMVTLRGDLDAERFARGLATATGLSVPGRGGIAGEDGRKIAWMSPDELMLFCGYDEAGGLAAQIDAALAGSHALVANVSDARACFRVEGAAVREVMAKLTPADVSPEGFGPGRMRRTRLAQVAAAFHMPDAACFEVIVFRSVARYAFELLSNAARPGGEVGIF